MAVGMGDITYGFFSYALSGQFSWDGLLRFIVASILGAIVFTAFLVSVQSLAFWMGRISNFSGFVFNAVITFGIYPITLFDNYAKLILFTVIPAAFNGAVPAAFIVSFSWRHLLELLAGAMIFLILALTVFRVGLKRYESGSAIQVEV